MVDLKRLRRGDLRIEDHGRAAYVWSAFAHYGLRALLGRRVRRDAAFVTDEYNNVRDEYWKPSTSLDDLIFGDDEHPTWILVDDQLTRGTLRDARMKLLPRLKDRIAANSKPGDLVVEFGAGTARNLAFLARELPDRRYIGLELTPRTVASAQQLLRDHDLPVEMRVADMTKAVGLEGQAAVAYSVLALEQLPHTSSRDALQQMAATATRAVICFEPIRELFPYSVRGLASRFRQYGADYLAGLPGHARSLGLKIAVEQRTGIAQNALNEICELVIERS